MNLMDMQVALALGILEARWLPNTHVDGWEGIRLGYFHLILSELMQARVPDRNICWAMVMVPTYSIRPGL